MPEDAKASLTNMTPAAYIGDAVKLTDALLSEIKTD
jgi:hypothetical protein